MDKELSEKKISPGHLSAWREKNGLGLKETAKILKCRIVDVQKMEIGLLPIKKHDRENIHLWDMNSEDSEHPMCFILTNVPKGLYKKSSTWIYDNVASTMRFFEYEHLPDHLVEASKLYYDTAWSIHEQLPPGPEKDFCLRYLMESKDYAVISKLGANDFPERVTVRGQLKIVEGKREYDLLTQFNYQHLKPPALQDISKKFHDLAVELKKKLSGSPEKTLAIRRLWESKNCAVRSWKFDRNEKRTDN